MPRERKEIFRTSKTIEKEKIIVLAFEGNETEEIYFEELKSSDMFNDDLIYLHMLTRPKSDTNSAPIHIFNKLKKEAKDEYNFNKMDELWMIIDRDRWRNIPQIIELCNKEGNMYVAGSNPCFELWLLLHVKDIDELTDEEKKKILQNKKVSTKKTYIDKFLSDILDNGYNKTNPRPERFLPFIKLAINQGKTLNSKDENFPSDLGSHVYKVVEKLIKNKV